MMTKVALITGAARRIGAAIVRDVHGKGMNVVIHYHRSETAAAALQQELNAARPGSAAILGLDLADIQRLPELIAQAQTHWSRLDALINNASSFYPTPIGTATEQQWDDLMLDNLKAPFFLAQAAAPVLAQWQGCIINITDIHAERPLSGYPIYSITKAGLVMLTKALAKELGPQVRVNGIAPGVVLWPEGDSELPDDIKTSIVERVALKRRGDPRDIAKAVWFLLRDADYITGQIITVDGGRSLQM